MDAYVGERPYGNISLEKPPRAHESRGSYPGETSNQLYTEREPGLFPGTTLPPYYSHLTRNPTTRRENKPSPTRQQEQPERPKHSGTANFTQRAMAQTTGRVGRTRGIRSKGHIDPLASPAWSPTWCIPHFLPKNKIKIKIKIIEHGAWNKGPLRFGFSS